MIENEMRMFLTKMFDAGTDACLKTMVARLRQEWQWDSEKFACSTEILTEAVTIYMLANAEEIVQGIGGMISERAPSGMNAGVELFLIRSCALGIVIADDMGTAGTHEEMNTAIDALRDKAASNTSKAKTIRTNLTSPPFSAN